VGKVKPVEALSVNVCDVPKLMLPPSEDIEIFSVELEFKIVKVFKPVNSVGEVFIVLIDIFCSINISLNLRK
tara:strand:- start:12154 stop:12369 length:216 start_codon:yes stop_codon:yes gene_type:complete